MTLAVMSPIIAFGGWVPTIINITSRQSMFHNLPGTISTVQLIACIGLMVTILTSIKLLPPRPARYKKSRNFLMLLQWILSPIIALVYTSAAAFYSQTRLMTGNYMEKFDVTKKVVKSE